MSSTKTPRLPEPQKLRDQSISDEFPRCPRGLKIQTSRSTTHNSRQTGRRGGIGGRGEHCRPASRPSGRTMNGDWSCAVPSPRQKNAGERSLSFGSGTGSSPIFTGRLLQSKIVHGEITTVENRSRGNYYIDHL